MATRVREHDWSRTPLGPIESWPQSLRVAVGICLNSRFPMFVWWGPQLINIYNDAYIPILGKRHPHALGRPARETWHEIWPVVGPQADAVMLRGEATWNERVLLVMERHGFTEETYFTWSYSPIPDDAGTGIGGLFCACTEETQRVRAEERVTGILESITDAFFAVDRDWRFTYLNAQAQRVLNRTDLLGKVIWDEYPGLIGSEFERVYRGAAREHVAQSLTSYYPDHDRWYEVHAFPASDGISVYFRNVTARKRDEEALRESEGRLSAILDNTQAMVYVVDAENRFRFINRRWETVLGMRNGATAGRSIYDFFPKDVADQFAANNRAVLESGSPDESEEVVPHADGPHTYISVKVPLFGGDGRAYAVCGISTDITDRKRAEAALRVSEERFRAAFDQSVVGIVLADLDGRILRANQAFCQIVGRRREELEGVTSQGFTHAEDVDRNVDIIGRLKARQANSSVYEKRYVRPDGVVVHAQISLSAVRDARDEVVGIIAGVQDVTERKRAEETLRQSEARYRELFESIDQGFCVIEMIFDGHGNPVDYRFVETNPAFERQTGLRDALGKRMRKLAPNHEQHWFDMYGRVALTGEPVRFVNKADALGRWYDVYAYRVGAAEERRVGILFNDITDRRHAEEAVRESGERLRLAVAIAQMGTFEIDLLTDAVTVNDTGREIYGWEPGEAMTFAKVQAHFHLEDKDHVMLSVGEALRPDGPGEFEVEQRITRRDGAVRWIRVRGRAAFEGEGAARRAVRCIGTYIDVTPQKEAERQREQLLAAERAARAEAERASEAKSEFLATLSHELRTPLTPVLLTVSLMESNPALPDELRDDVATIRRNVELESRLISDLLDLTRITKGKLQLDAQDVDLHLILRSAIDICQREASAKLVVDLHAARHVVRGDSTRLQQIFWNLINNAMKFTGPEGTVTVRTSDNGDGVRVEVIDTGVGIDPTVLPRLFNAFEQGDVRADRKQAGLGLGLAISKRLTEAHGGTVWAASAGRGRGATFTVELPTVAQFVPESPPPRTAPGRASAADPLSVLVVEDHEPTLKVMLRLLKHLGHHVTGATTVAAATAAARQDGIDLIISDLGLPDGSGLDVMRQLRDRYAGRAIALTGYGMESDIAASRDAGFAEHLTKPVDLASLEAAIARLRLTSSPSPTAPPAA